MIGGIRILATLTIMSDEEEYRNALQEAIITIQVRSVRTSSITDPLLSQVIASHYNQWAYRASNHRSRDALSL